MPIIIVEKTIQHIELFSFIDSIRPETQIRLLDNTITLNGLSPRPPLYEHLLKARGYVGWNAVIGVIDSGINNVVGVLDIKKSVDFTGPDIGNDGTDLFGHGTTVAHIINTFAPKAKLINIRVTNSQDIQEAKLIKAMEWVYFKPKMNIINLSLGALRNQACDGSCEICQLADKIAQKGILVVASAGNEGPVEGTIRCPGVSTSAVTVGAIDYNNNVASFSSRGYSGQDKPDLVTSGHNDSPDLRFSAGTSFSAPIISGVAAAIYNECSDNKRLKDILCQSTVSIRAKRNHQGTGKLDLNKLLEVLDNDKTASKSIQS